MSTKKSKVLTPGELEIMRVLWKSGSATARQVVNEISSHRKTAYTTIQTLMTIMQRKGYLEVKSSGKAHIFTPIITRSQAQSMALKNMVDELFDCSAGTLAQHIVDSGSLDAMELELLRDLIDQHREDDRTDQGK